jgi:hypothetical protein
MKTKVFVVERLYCKSLVPDLLEVCDSVEAGMAVVNRKIAETGESALFKKVHDDCGRIEVRLHTQHYFYCINEYPLMSINDIPPVEPVVP